MKKKGFHIIKDSLFIRDEDVIFLCKSEFKWYLVKWRFMEEKTPRYKLKLGQNSKDTNFRLYEFNRLVTIYNTT